MKIRKIKLASFGCLQGEYELSTEKCNLVVEENEMGKTTLVTAIMAALYGFTDRKSKFNPVPLSEAYRPWDDEHGYTVELTLDYGGRSFIIRRDFGREKVQVLDAKTGKDITAQFHRGKGEYLIGERMLKMTADDFRKSFLVRQDDISAITDAGELTKIVQKVASSSLEEATSSEAIRRLEASLERHYDADLEQMGMMARQGIMVETALLRLEEQIERRRDELSDLEQKRGEKNEQIEMLLMFDRRQKEHKSEQNRLEYLSLVAERNEIEKQVEADGLTRSELGRLQKELSELEMHRAFPAHQWENLVKLQTALEETHQRIGEKQESLKMECDAPLEEITRDLKRYGDIKEFTRDDFNQLLELSISFKDLWDQLSEEKTVYDKELMRIRDEGESIQLYDTLREQFSRFTDDERKFIEIFRERQFQRERDLEKKAAELKDFEAVIGGVKRKRGSIRKTSAVFAVLGIGLTSVSVAFSLGILGMIFGVMLLVAGALGLILSASLHADILSRATLAAAAIEQEIEEVERDVQSSTSRLLELSTKAGFSSSELLIDEFKRHSELERKMIRVKTLQEEIEDAQRRISLLIEKLQPLVQKTIPKDAAVTLPLDLTPELVNDAVKRCRSYLEVLAQHRELEKQRLQRVQDIDAERDRHQRMLEDFKRLLSDANVINYEGISDGMEQFKDRKSKYDRYVSIRKEIPSIENRLLRSDELEKREARLEQVKQKVAQLASERPEFSQLTASKTTEEYLEDWRRLAREIETEVGKRDQLLREVDKVMQEYRERYPKIEEELDLLRMKKRKLENFKSSVMLAKTVLQQVSKEVYAQWSDVLNERTSEALKHMNRHYSDVRFDEDLTFTVQWSDGRRLDSTQAAAYLSRGARDQLYLALRIGISEYLSSALGALPMIFDEPFANTDDERFLEAMKFLAEELSQRHQVIILTCHQQRHAWLRERMPDLVNARIEVVRLRK